MGNLDNGMKNTILHELIHFQQNYRDPDNRNTILGTSIQEGVCDFMVCFCGINYVKGKALSAFNKDYDEEYMLGKFQKDIFTMNLSFDLGT